MPAIRVAVQGWLCDGKPSGARSRLLGLLAGLGKLPEARAFEILVLASDRGPLDAALARTVARLDCARLLRVPIPPGPTIARARAEARFLRRWLAEEEVALVDHATLPLPRTSLPICFTLHDLRELGPFARGWRRLAAPALLPRALRRARVTVVPSPPVADEVGRRFPWARAKVTVVPACLPARRAPDTCGAASARGFVHVGRPEARKGLGFLIDAYADACKRAPEPDELGELVLVGRARPREWRRLRARGEALGIGRRLRILDGVEDAALPALYARALALVFPSRLEGFGIPVLEAMSVGTPSLVSEGTATAWVAAAAGVALPAGDREAWAAALLRVARDAELRRSLSRACASELARFTPVAAARAWIGAWQRALATPELAEGGG